MNNNEQQTFEVKLHNLFEPIQYEEQKDIEENGQHLSLEDIAAEREAMLRNAEEEIAIQKLQLENERNEQLQALEALREAWEQEKIQLQQQAYDEGFAQGFEDGVQKANEQMANAVSEANETIQQAQENAKAYVDAQEHVLLHIAMTSAEKILNTSLEQNEELYLSVIQRALKEVRDNKEIKLYVSAHHYAIITKYRDELAELFPVDVPFMIFVNEDLSTNDSFIETNQGRIVVSIDDQLFELKQKLVEILDSKE
jgi:flagellar assembly protein FliH